MPFPTPEKSLKMSLRMPSTLFIKPSPNCQSKFHLKMLKNTAFKQFFTTFTLDHWQEYFTKTEGEMLGQAQAFGWKSHRNLFQIQLERTL